MVPDRWDEIYALDKTSFAVQIEDGKIASCLGVYISLEQNTARLLGPFVDNNEFSESADALLKMCLQQLPEQIEKLKIAFFQENKACASWCEERHFQQYNAELTMELRKVKELAVNGLSYTIVPYEQHHREGLAAVHPAGTFFSLNELLSNVDDRRYLLVGIHEGKVTGYIHYERSEDHRHGEIVLLHVGESYRGKGHGTLLLYQAISHLQNLGVSNILTNVRVANAGARKLYERMGFKARDVIYAYEKEIAR